MSLLRKPAQFILFIALVALLIYCPAGHAGDNVLAFKQELAGDVGIVRGEGSRLGIKLNRPIREYPVAVLKDLERFKKDRLSTVMLTLPWTQWATQNGALNRNFIEGKLAKVLEYASKQDIPIVLSVHCSFWGRKGSWSIPKGIRELGAFDSSSSVLTNPTIRGRYIAFLKELADSTASWDVIVAYNILNEPVAATRSWVGLRQTDFSERWKGVMSITEAVRSAMDANPALQGKALIVGTANGDPAYAEHVWHRTGKLDLQSFWRDKAKVVSGQYPDVLEAANQWFPTLPRIRTEGFLSFASHKAWLAGKPYRWEKGENGGAMYYDYDAAYNYEGLRNLNVKGLIATYVWRIGSPDGSKKHLWLLDHRDNDRPTPYYFALRDLASGIDSFEAYSSPQLPRNKGENLKFDPHGANRALSVRWQGNGEMTPSREPSPKSDISTMSAMVSLKPEQHVERKVITNHWLANGVDDRSAFVLQLKSESPGKLTLYAVVDDRMLTSNISLNGDGWQDVSVSFKEMGLQRGDLTFISTIGFKNPSVAGVRFWVDEFLVR